MLSDEPLAIDDVIKQSKKLLFLGLSEGESVLLESRPNEGGRSTLVDADGHELTPAPFNLKSRVNTYGGKCFTFEGNLLFFFSDHDQSLYLKKGKSAAIKIFNKKFHSFVDFCFCPKRECLYGVLEVKNEHKERLSVFSLNINSLELSLLHAAEDFYACVKVSPCGQKLAFISWSNPDMPWDRTKLWIKDFQDEAPPRVLYDQNVSSSHLLWTSENTLIFNSEISGYWNLLSYENKSIVSLTNLEIEFGSAHWIFGTSRFCQVNKNLLVAIGTNRACDTLYLINIKTKEIKLLDIPVTTISEVCAYGDLIFFIGSGLEIPPSICKYDWKKEKFFLCEKNLLPPKKGLKCERFSFPTNHSVSCDLFFYSSNDFQKNRPLILKIHSGPTSHISYRFGMDILFFTSRGFNFAELNYRGSTGYGKAFRESLNEQWGKADVDDVINCAHFLIDLKLADPSSIFLKGSSAGGLTTLLACCQSPLFKGGVCYYGISDLEKMAQHTHRFEEYYLTHLIGPYPEKKELYIERSPLFISISHLPSLLFFQGGLDEVTPKEQTISFYEKMKKSGSTCELVIFEDEGHGFRKEISLRASLEKELSFYERFST